MSTRTIRRRRRRGFTLMEILLVLAILVVLGSLVTFGYVTIQRNAMMDSAKTQIRMFEQAVDMYRLDVGKYPSGDQGLQALRLQPPDAAPNKWRGPYIQVEIPTDPWGNAYQYQEITDSLNQPSFEVMSNGPDGANGTPDDIRLPK
jgi:general secretion pathway protein G